MFSGLSSSGGRRQEGHDHGRRHVRQVRPQRDQDLPERRHRDKDGKKTTYYIVHEAVSKKAHGSMGFCRATKDKPIKVKVTGTVEEKDDKMD